MADISFTGNLARDPELRFTDSGAAVVSFTVMENRSRYDARTQQRVELTPNAWRCSAWRGFAEQIAGNFSKGDNVLVKGEPVMKSYTDKDSGKTVWYVEVEVTEIGASPRFANLEITRKPRQDDAAGAGAEAVPAAAGATNGGAPLTDPF